MGFWTRLRPVDSMRKARVGSTSKSHLRFQHWPHSQGSSSLPQSSCQSNMALCQVCRTSFLFFLLPSISLLSDAMLFHIQTNVLSHYFNLFVVCSTTYTKSCTLKKRLDSAVMLWRHHFTEADIFIRLSQQCWRKSKASTTKWEQITHRGPALHGMRSCEPRDRKQQRITVGKLLLGMKK